MTLTFDRATDCYLLAEIATDAIETDEEYENLLKVAERLNFAKNPQVALNMLAKVPVPGIENPDTA